MIEEPQLLGAVVETEDGRIWMRYPDDKECSLYRWVSRWEHTGTVDAWQWGDVACFNPVLRFEGFKPRPKEPTLPCAVVRDKEERLFVRSDDTAQPWRLHTKYSQHLTAVWFHWSQIPDPEVIFEGVSK